MVTTLETMFRRPALLNQIKAIHNDIVEALDTAAERLGKDTLSLFDIICLPESGGIPNIDGATMAKIQKRIMEEPGDHIDWKAFGVYNRVQCAVMDRMWGYALCLMIEGYDVSRTDWSPDELQTAGLLALKSSTALAAKYAWIYYGTKSDFVDRDYWGNPSCTSPVRDFFKRHFGMCSPAQHEINRYTFKVAEELGMNPLDVNTAMWVMELDK